VIQTQRYAVDAHWNGDKTGDVGPKEIDQPIRFSAPVEFGGEPSHWTPEHFLVAAVASCYVATFTAMARLSKLEVVELGISVTGEMSKWDDGWRFTAVTIHPRLIISDVADRERAERLLVKAERGCLVARSLSAKISLQPVVHLAEAVTAAV
jgi:peroxiredoxin-like protein